MKERAGHMSGSRRTFLKAAAAAGGAGMLADAVALPGDSVTRETNSPAEPADAAAGYHETAHIREYYRTLRD